MQRLLLAQLEPVVPAGFRLDPEHRFHPVRKWRIDVAVHDTRPGPRPRHLAIEIDGGGWVRGRHARGSGIEKDAEKSAHLAAAGYRLVRVTPSQIRTGQALDWLRACLAD